MCISSLMKCLFRYFSLFKIRLFIVLLLSFSGLYIFVDNSPLTAAAAAAKSLQSCPTLCDTTYRRHRPHRRQPTRLPRPWDSPGKNTGVGCHFLLQCRKVKSEREVAQSCPTLRDPMDCSLPGSSVHGIFQARVPEWGAIAFSILLPEVPSKLLSPAPAGTLNCGGHRFPKPWRSLR